MSVWSWRETSRPSPLQGQLTVWTVTVCHNDSNRRMWMREKKLELSSTVLSVHWLRASADTQRTPIRQICTVDKLHTHSSMAAGNRCLTHWVVVLRPTRSKTDLQNILRQPYDNAKVMIDLRWTNLLNTCEERKAFLRHDSLAKS